MPATIVQNHTEQFLALWRHQQARLDGHLPAELAAIQQRAANALASLRFPTRRDEDWKYTSVTPIVSKQWQLPEMRTLPDEVLEGARFEGLDAIRLVFINGQWHPDLSTHASEWPEGLFIAPVYQVLATEHSSWLAESLQSHTSHHNPFVVLNTAFGNNGLYIEAAENTEIDRPIHVMMLSVGDVPFMQCPQLWVHAKRNSALSIIEHYFPKEHAPHTEMASHFTCAVSRLRVEANARVNHYRLQRESHRAYQINYCMAEQCRDSLYNSFTVDLGGSIVRNNLDVVLGQSNTETHLYGIYLLAGEQHVDNQTFMDHAVPHCMSNELYKGIVTGRARGVFNGKVLVRPDAQKTNAFQQNSTLLLSPDAVMDAKPQLEIFADDVRCSHGATIGQLDESAVFYLRTRGITEPHARKMLQFAFLEEVLQNMPHDPVRELMEKLVAEKLEQAV